jgi:aminopeptidase S
VVSAIFLDIDNNAVLPVTIFSDDFETDLVWQTDPSFTDTATTGQWVRANPEDTNSGGAQQLGTTVSGSFDLVTGPLAGTSVGTHDIDNGVTSIRSPDIILDSGSSSITLSFHSYMAHLNNATPDDFFRASISDGATTTVVYEELGSGDQDNAVWEEQTIDITSFAGQTVHILFEAADAASAVWLKPRWMMLKLLL